MVSCGFIMWIGGPLSGDPQSSPGDSPHELWGSPKPRKSLKTNILQLRYHYFEVFWEKGDPQSSCGESPHELGGSPERGRLIHMEGFQIQFAVALIEVLVSGHMWYAILGLDSSLKPESWSCCRVAAGGKLSTFLMPDMNGWSKSISSNLRAPLRSFCISSNKHVFHPPPQKKKVVVNGNIPKLTSHYSMWMGKSRHSAGRVHDDDMPLRYQWFMAYSRSIFTLWNPPAVFFP